MRTVDLGRWYGQVVGLNDVSVDVEPGVIGLVGPNGAGKSTFLKLVAGELAPSRGSIEVLGERPFANRALFRRMGFAPQQDALWDHLTGMELVTFLLRLHGYSKADAQRRAGAALERVQLDAAKDRRVAGYSKGMRQRVKLAQAIAHEPELLVVDEPLTGLDPVARHDTLELFRELGEAGASVLLSSHVLHEVETLTEEILLIHRGRLLAQGSVPEVRKLLNSHPRRVRIRAREPRRLARVLVEMPTISSIKLTEDELSLEAQDFNAFVESFTGIAAETRAGVTELDSPDASLEAVFDYLVS